MDYLETIAYIHQMPKFSRALGNDMLRKLLDHLGNPHRSLKFVHIAGTNGKGSAAAMLAEILRCSNLRTGLFISPYIQVFNERIQVDGCMIEDQELAEIVTHIRQVMERENCPVSEFALDFTAALMYFCQKKCDVVVLETGMGGRLDATNVIEESVVSILMTISLDHTQYLGDTVEAIAAEKCGIIKPNGRVVLYPLQQDSVKAVVEHFCKEQGAKLVQAAMPVPMENGLVWNGKRYQLGLRGGFQAYNAATVLEAVKVLRDWEFSIPERAVEQGLARVRHMARFEFITPNIILDGGHNPQAIERLTDALKALKRPVVLCMAMMEDKDYKRCIEVAASVAQKAVVTGVDMPRCCPPEKLSEVFSRQGVEAAVVFNCIEAVQTAIDMAGSQGVVCVCGSLYLAGKVRKAMGY